MDMAMHRPKTTVIWKILELKESARRFGFPDFLEDVLFFVSFVLIAFPPFVFCMHPRSSAFFSFLWNLDESFPVPLYKTGNSKMGLKQINAG